MELVVTIVLVGILAATAAPRFFKRQTFDARGFSDQVQGMIRYAQKIAVARQRPVFVHLNPSNVALCYDANCSSKVTYPTGTGTTSCDGGNTWFCAAVPTSLTYTSSHSVFYYNALGQPVGSNNTVLGARVTITITGDTSPRVITVNPETGYVQS